MFSLTLTTLFISLLIVAIVKLTSKVITMINRIALEAIKVARCKSFRMVGFIRTKVSYSVAVLRYVIQRTSFIRSITYSERW